MKKILMGLLFLVSLSSLASISTIIPNGNLKNISKGDCQASIYDNSGLCDSNDCRALIYDNAGLCK